MAVCLIVPLDRSVRATGSLGGQNLGRHPAESGQNVGSAYLTGGGKNTDHHSLSGTRTSGCIQADLLGENIVEDEQERASAGVCVHVGLESAARADDEWQHGRRPQQGAAPDGGYPEPPRSSLADLDAGQARHLFRSAVAEMECASGRFDQPRV